MQSKLFGSVAALALMVSYGVSYAQAPQQEHGSAMEQKAGSAREPAAKSPAGEMQTHRSSAETAPASKPMPEKAAESEPKRDMKAAETPKTEAKPAASAASENPKSDKQKAAETTKAPDKKAAEANKPADPKATDTKAADANKPADLKAKDAANKDAANKDSANKDKPGNDHNAAAQRPTDPNAAKRDNAMANQPPEKQAEVLNSDPQKQTKVRDVLRDQHAENITKVDFDVRVGGMVPDHYHFYPLPTEVVDIVPQYRGYDYIVANDDIVILEPRTHRIVYTMQQGRSSARDAKPVECR